jgi:hypothetical protein
MPGPCKLRFLTLTLRHKVWTFLRLIWAEWSNDVTSRLSALLFVAGLGAGMAGVLGAPLPAERVTLPLSWVVAVMAGVKSAFNVWRKADTARLAAEEKLGELQKRGIELALLEGRWLDGDNPKPAASRHLILVSVRNNSGIPINDCLLKGTPGGRDEVYANDVCKPFSLGIGETTHKPFLSFETATRIILLPIFSNKPEWSLHGRIFDPPGPHQFVFLALSSSASVARLMISASFETGDWKFSEG